MNHESDGRNVPDGEKKIRPKRPGKKRLRKPSLKGLVAATGLICLWAVTTAFCVSADGKHMGDPGFIQAWFGFGIVLLGSLLVWTAVACFFVPRWVEQAVYGTQGAEGAVQYIFGVALLMSAAGAGLMIIGIFAFDLLK